MLLPLQSKVSQRRRNLTLKHFSDVIPSPNDAPNPKSNHKLPKTRSNLKAVSKFDAVTVRFLPKPVFQAL